MYRVSRLLPRSYPLHLPLITHRAWWARSDDAAITLSTKHNHRFKRIYESTLHILNMDIRHTGSGVSFPFRSRFSADHEFVQPRRIRCAISKRLGFWGYYIITHILPDRALLLHLFPRLNGILSSFSSRALSFSHVIQHHVL